jgi:E1A/CREB-binding protein
MARRLEESLFRSAVSFEEYRDTQTLKKRLQALAIAMGLRAQQQKQKTDEGASVCLGPNNSMDRPNQGSSAETNHGLLAEGSSGRLNTMLGASSTSSTLSGCVSSSASVPTSKRLVSLSEINPLMSSGTATEDRDALSIQADSGKLSRANGLDGVSLGTTTSRDAPIVQRPYHADQRQQVLRQQQQRLLLLRHASKCPHENGTCPVTPHCGGMKRLWKHIAECKDQQCQMAHCVSSRYVLSHYHRCKDPRCAVCGPVREAIQRNHEKAKQLAMAQL